MPATGLQTVDGEVLLESFGGGMISGQDPWLQVQEEHWQQGNVAAARVEKSVGD